MAQEMKLKLSDYKKTEQGFRKLGAKFLKGVSSTDTYFEQPAGKVLKLVEGDEGAVLTELQARTRRHLVYSGNTALRPGRQAQATGKPSTAA